MDADNGPFVRTNNLSIDYRVTKNQNRSKCKGLVAGEGWLIHAFCRIVRAYNSLLRGANLVCTHSRASSTQQIQQTVQFSPPSRLQLLMHGALPQLRVATMYHYIRVSRIVSFGLPFACGKIVWERD